MPGIGFNFKAKDNYQKLVARFPENAKILIVGGSIQGKGMELIYSNDSFELVGTDVSYGDPIGPRFAIGSPPMSQMMV